MSTDKKIPLLVIVGATASGKTSLGIGMAKFFDGEVISADSMQIYKNMGIATATPTADEMDGIPHHLIDFLDVTESFSVARYVELAAERIRNVHSRGKLPIIVGGTGLYVNSLIDNIEFVDAGGDEQYRSFLRERAEKEGAQALLDELMLVDKETALKLHPNNLGRIIRALELYKTTGVTMSEQVERSRRNPSPYSPVVIGIDYLDRANLYARINLRVDIMMENGLVDEARTMREKTEKTAAQAIGHKELEMYFRGEATLEQAAENLKIQTRRYAKRQLTWFRRDERIKWIYADDEQAQDSVLERAKRIYLEERKKDSGEH
ncbi:MAG: tRNA (adenosine(37)-N6)-dimethylallyltransferase MiaA [Clostridia bacterium]|nr:tRNA (adenosine(37)-N6)-dimethylallyltransferase MiaA [Clostridia bacterium]